MQDFLRWLLSLKGVHPEPGAELRLELSAFPSGGQALLWIVGILAVLVLVSWVYRRDGKVLSRGQRFTLHTLRALAVLLAVLVLLEPTVVAVKREVRPGHTLMLLDLSQSMTHVDSYRREEVQPLAAAWRALGVEAPEAARRLDLVKALLGHRNDQLLRELAKKNKVLIYGFESGLVPLATIDPLPADAKPETLFDASKLEANGRFTNHGAMQAALEKSRDAQIAAVILLGDGRKNLGKQGAELARVLTNRKVPHTFVLPVGDPSEAQYVEVLRIDAPEKVFQRDPFRIGASIVVQGYPSLTLNVKLLAQPPGGGAATVVQTKAVTLGGDRKDAQIEFLALKADTVGSMLYAVEVEPPSGEPPVPEKHRKQAQVEVLGEQMRVLLIAGGPTHEYRILRNQLIRDKTIDVACWLQSADKDFPQDGDTKLEALPKDQKELEPYDVFILMDPDSRSLSREFSELVSKHVLEDGAGLWWVCGEKYALDAMRESSPTRSLAELLPVVPDIAAADLLYSLGRAFPRPNRYELTPEGVAHVGVTRLLEDKEQSALLWPRLAGYHVAFPIVRAKPAAVTLVGQGNPALARAGAPMPLLVQQFIGAGRVLFSATDETFRWRSRHEAAYDSYWVKGARWLFEGRINAGNSRLRIRLGETKVELGEPVKVVVDAKDEAFAPWSAPSLDLTVRREGGRTETVHLAPVEGVPGQYEATIRPTEAGFYRLKPAQSFGREVETSLQIVPAAIEKEGPVDLGELGAIAAAAGGKLLQTPQDLLDAAPRIASATATDVFPTPHALWDSMVTVVAVLLLLAAEWWLRKRWNLL